MRATPEHTTELISELTNSLQSAFLLASRLEPGLRQAARDAGGNCLPALDRVSTAAQQLRPARTRAVRNESGYLRPRLNLRPRA